MWKPALAFAVLLLFLLPSGMSAADELISGLNLRVENCPSQVRVGENLSFQVRVINQSEQTVQGVLRAYLYGNTNTIYYPSSSDDIVFLHEGGREAHDENVEIPVGEQTFSFNVSTRPDVQLVSTVAKARLRVRLGNVENGVFSDICTSISKDIVILPAAASAAVPEAIMSVKLGVGVAVATALVLSVMNLRKLNERLERQPSNSSVRRRAHRSRVKS